MVQQFLASRHLQAVRVMGRPPSGTVFQAALLAVGARYPAQQDSCFTSLVKVCAASFSPSTIVK